jgi:hypothetical protein
VGVAGDFSRLAVAQVESAHALLQTNNTCMRS